MVEDKIPSVNDCKELNLGAEKNKLKMIYRLLNVEDMAIGLRLIVEFENEFPSVKCYAVEYELSSVKMSEERNGMWRRRR